MLIQPQSNSLMNSTYQRPLEPPVNRLTSYAGNTLSVKELIGLSIGYRDNVTGTCYVVGSPATPLLSLPTSIALCLARLTSSVENHQTPITDLEQKPC